MLSRKFVAPLLALFGATIAATLSHEALGDGLVPARYFLQVGDGDQKTTAYTFGATWNLSWRYDFSLGTVAAYSEIALGRWHTDDGRGTTAWPTQLSATPTLRIVPRTASTWFAEVGVGANYIVPLFRSGRKRFSTEFNFGDHVAVGHNFGHSEVSLRMEHFSNAGIEHPNPGENFAQLRYAYQL